MWCSSVATGGPSAVACSYRRPHEPSSPTTNYSNRDDGQIHTATRVPRPVRFFFFYYCSPAAFCQTSGCRCWKRPRLRAESEPPYGWRTCQSNTAQRDFNTARNKIPGKSIMNTLNRWYKCAYELLWEINVWRNKGNEIQISSRCSNRKCGTRSSDGSKMTDTVSFHLAREQSNFCWFSTALLQAEGSTIKAESAPQTQK